MLRTPLIVVLVSFVSLVSLRAQAAPLTMTHSGYLLDAGDQPITSAALSMTFAIHNARNPDDIGAQTIWTSDVCNVAVSKGLYAVLLGGSCNSAAAPLDTTHLPTGQTRYLEATVGGVKLLPRMFLGTVPTAALATHALEADTVGGEGPAALHDATKLTGAAPIVTLQPAIDAAKADSDAQLAVEAAARIAGDSAAVADARLSSNVALWNAASPTFVSLVGAAGFTAAGDFTATGTGRFAGNGSGLTNVSASALTAGTAGINISGSAASFTGGLAGDVTGTQGATTVAKAGGVTAANLAAGANAANAATSANTAGTLVKRDASGHFTAGALNLSGLTLPGGAAGRLLTSDASGNASWQPQSGITQWTTSGSNIAYSAGNVGIGTTSPTQALDVVGIVRTQAETFANTYSVPCDGTWHTILNHLNAHHMYEIWADYGLSGQHSIGHWFMGNTYNYGYVEGNSTHYGGSPFIEVRWGPGSTYDYPLDVRTSANTGDAGCRVTVKMREIL